MIPESTALSKPVAGPGFGEDWRIEMEDTYNYLVDALRAAPTVLDTLLHGCTPGQAQAVHGDEDWSVVEIICHLRDNEECAL